MLAFLDGLDKSAVIVSLVAVVPGALAYLRGRRTDRRVNDLDTLRTIVEALQSENQEISERLDRCEESKAESSNQLLYLRAQVLRLEMDSDDPP